jgi:DNA-binding winged helix-turn-helix (wHTH) protein/Flp pilus assembly protein TadD
MNHSGKRIYEFGPFRLDVTAQLLMRGEELVPLTPKVLRMLQVLIERRGELVEREELMKAVWPDSCVEIGNLSSNIFMLRKALGDDRNGHCYIATVSRRGYRFVAQVQELGAARADAADAAVKSIAVLPFRPLGAAGDDEYLGLGIADALITRLSNLRQIVVRPTSAVLRYSGLEPDPVSAGRELGVETVVEGSIQRADERIRVTVQLVSVTDGAPLWAEKFDEKFTDIFAVEDVISARVAEALTLRLLDEEKRMLSRHRTENTEAYQLYLQGHYYWNKRTEEGLQRGIEYFAQAVEKDPGYALAFVGLADSYTLMGCVHGSLAPREAVPKAKTAALRALRLDDTLTEAHASLGLMRVLYDWDWMEAEREFRRALELSPSHVTARHWYGLYLAWMGRLDEALAELGRAQRLDPLSPIISANVAWAYYSGRQHDRAIEQCRRTIEMDATFHRTHIYLGWAYTQTGDYDAAIAELQRARELSGSGPEATGLGYAYAVAGRTSEAHALIAELQERARRRYISPYAVALVYAGLGEVDQAFEWLDRAYEDRTHWLVMLRVEPRLDSLRADPRFAALLCRIGLEDGA